MAAVKIGANAPLLSDRTSLNFVIGQRVAALKKALEDAHNIKLMIDQIADADLLALGFGDGNNGTANEIGYLRSGLLACEDLDKLRLGQTPTNAPPHVYENDLKYLSQL